MVLAQLSARGWTAPAAVVLSTLLLGGCGGATAGQQSYTNRSASMEPTLKNGERFAVNSLAYWHASPKRGDIVVFHPGSGAEALTAGAGSPAPICGVNSEGLSHAQACDTPTPTVSRELFIKRVVAVAWDRISVVNGRVIRNGVPERAGYVEPCGGDTCNFPTAIVIPPGEYFMMGDNRGASFDSRFWGPVPKAWILGKVLGH